jgi:hypothetical protein
MRLEAATSLSFDIVTVKAAAFGTKVCRLLLFQTVLAAQLTLTSASTFPIIGRRELDLGLLVGFQEVDRKSRSF